MKKVSPTLPLLLLLATATASCSDVTAPIDASDVLLHIRSATLDDRVHGVVESKLHAEVSLDLDPAAPSPVGEITAIDLSIPGENETRSIPVAFQGRAGDRPSTTLLVDRSGHPPAGEYEATVHFTNGARAGAAMTFEEFPDPPLPVIREATFVEGVARLQWTAPPVAHSWELELHRVAAGTTVLVRAGSRGTASGADDFSSGFELDPQSGTAYAFVLASKATTSYSRVTIPVTMP